MDGLGYNTYDRDWERIPGLCGNCGLMASLSVRDRRRLWPELTSNLAPIFDEYIFEVVLVCTHCAKSTLVLVRYEAGDEQFREPVQEIVVWPRVAPRQLDEAVPAGVVDLYREASECENVGAYRGAAGLYRAAVEALCREFGLDGGVLASRIDELRKHSVPDDVVSALHEARLLGNWSLHDGVEFSADEVSDVAELINEACHSLYVEPAKRAAMRVARQERREAAREARGS